MLAASNEKKEGEKVKIKKKIINFNQKILPKSIATIIVRGLKFLQF